MGLTVRWLVAVALVFLSAPVWAQIHYFTLIDTDNNTATGCTVTLPNTGTVTGIERRLTATISETATPQVISLTLESCVGGSFDAPVSLPGTPYPVGLNNGVGGADVIEQAAPADAIAPPGPPVRLYFAAQGSTSDDLLGASGGSPILFGLRPTGESVGIPTLSEWGLLGLILILLVAVIRQRSHLPASMVGILLVGMVMAGIVWAAGFLLDGQINDWQGVPAAGTDAGGDSTSNTTDILAAFAAREGGNAFFRIDVADAQTPNHAPSFTKGADQTVLEDAGAQTVNGWATAIDDGDPDSVQNLTFQITNNTNPGLFSAEPAVAANGTLTYTPADNANGSATITLVLKDDGGTANGGVDTSPAQTFVITVTPVNDAPSFTKGADQTVDEDAGAQTVGWATAISAGPANESGQSLSFEITGNTNPGLFSAGPAISPTGVLTYTPAANVFGSAILTVRLKDNGGTTNGGVDTSASQTFGITVNSVNDPPTITGQNSVSTAEDTSRAIVFTDLTVSDPDNSYPTGFTLTVNDGANYTHIGNTITPALDFNGNLTVPVIVNDGTNDSNIFSLTVVVTAVNDAPVNVVPGAQSTDEDVPLVFNVANGNAISISDVDVGGGDLAVTLSVTTGTLTLSGTAGLAFSVGDGNDDATMTFTGSLAAINVALAGLSFQPPLNATGDSELSLVTNDQGNTGTGGALSDTDTVTITINPVNDAPVIANLAGDTLAYTQGEPASVIDQGDDASATDVDSSDFDTGTLTISLPIGGVTTEDRLGIRNQGTAAGQIAVSGSDISYNPGAGAVAIGSFSGGGAGGGNLVATFNANANAAAVSALLRNITYFNSNNVDPSIAARTVRFVLTDGDGGTSIDYDATVTVALNDPPVVTTSAGTTAFFEDGSAVVIDNALIVTDTNDTNLESATVTITNLQDTGLETLTANTGGTAINANYAAPTLTLTGTDTLANYQQVLRSVAYDNASQNPNTTARVISFVANDGSANSTPATKTVSVTAVNDAPTFTKGADQTVLEDASAQTVSPWASAISDGDGGTQTLTFNITGNTNPGLFSAGPAISPAGVLTYTPAANANGTATITVTLSDNGGTTNGGVDTSAAQTFVINVTAVNDAPSFAAGGNQAVIEDAGLQTAAGWATSISAGPANEAGQTLNFIITGNTNPSLFSAGPAVASNGTLTYTPAPNQNGSATITLVLMDNAGTANGGVDTSTSQNFAITVNAVNDPPVAQNKSGFSAQANMAVVGIDAGLLTGVTDADAGINGCNPTFSVASITANTGGTVSGVNLAAGTFDFNPAPGFTGTALVDYTVQDNGCPGSATSAPATISITVSGPVIWFVNGSAAGGNGTLAQPFQTVAQADAVDAANQAIFVYTGTYTNGITLNSGEWLIGQGVSGASFDNVFGITPPTGTIARPAINGTRPTLQNTVTMGASSQVKGLNISSGSNTGITASGQTGLVTGEVGVATTTGTAANFSNSGGTLSFTSISANGAANGIVLNTTTGSFTVTGTGTTTGTGGTIQNTSNRGASFISASNITLKNMNFTNAGTADLDADNSGLSTGDNLATNAAIHLQNVTTVTLDNLAISGGAEQGINGNTVSNFTLSNSSIVNAGNEPDEDSIHFFNMSGTSAITNTTMNCTVPTPNTTGGDDHLNLQMQSGTLNLTISGGSATNANKGSGYLFGIRGNSNATITFDNSANSSNNFSGGIVADAFDTSTMRLTVANSTSSSNNDQLSVSAGDNSHVFLYAHDNTLSSPNPADFVVVSLLGSALDNGFTFDATVSNNTMTVGNDLTTDGIVVFNAGGGAMNVKINNNTLNYRGTQRAILLQSGQDGAGAINATITGNDIDVQLDGTSNAVNGILAQAAITSPTGDGASVCADIGGAGVLSNTFTHSLGGALAGGDIRVRQRNNGTMRLPGYGGSATDTAAVASYLDGRNTEVSPSTASVQSTGFAGGGACTQPTLP